MDAGVACALFVDLGCGRRCFAMEIEPAFVAVALERLSDMGLKPNLVSG